MSDATSRVRNATAELADQMRRLEKAQARLRDALKAARAEGVTETEITVAVTVACAGRPDRARALEAFAMATAEGEATQT